jgi:hypothetical protein
MEKDFDKIRKKTGIDKLASDERKKLFEEFVEHGGKVTEEKKHPFGTILRSSQRTHRPGHPQKTEEQKPETQNALQAGMKKGIAAGNAKEKKKRKKKKLRDFITVYIRGLMLNVFTLSGSRFTEAFVLFVQKHIKESLLDLKVTIDSFLHGENSIKKEILHLSTAENSTYYEFLVRMGNLYNEEEFTLILNAVSVRTVPKKASIDIFKSFFKRLYILGQYSDLCKLYMDKSLDLQLKKKLLNADMAPAMRAQLKKDINTIISDFLLKLHIIICRIDRTYYPLFSQKLDDFLEMTDQDRIGYITAKERKRRLEELKQQKEYLRQQRFYERGFDKEEIKVPKHVARGFDLMNSVLDGLEKQREKRENDPVFLMDQKDKMFKSIVFFEDFDDQYSFILTTSKIAFNIDYREQKKVDIKRDLSNAYLLFSEAREEVKNYMDLMKETKKTEENLRLTEHQKQMSLETLAKKRSVSSKSARVRIAEVMKTIESSLSLVISDYNTTKRILQNPDGVLLFDPHIDGIKRLHGKKIIEAIIESFLYASSFAFLLNFGELAGSGLFIESENE